MAQCRIPDEWNKEGGWEEERGRRKEKFGMEQELVRKRSPSRRQPLTSTNEPGGWSMPQARGRGKDDARRSADSAFERVCPQARGEGGKREGGVEPPPVKTNGTSASPPPLLPLRQTILPISSFTTKDQAHHQYEDEDDGRGWRRMEEDGGGGR